MMKHGYTSIENKEKVTNSCFVLRRAPHQKWKWRTDHSKSRQQKRNWGCLHSSKKKKKKTTRYQAEKKEPRKDEEDVPLWNAAEKNSSTAHSSPFVTARTKKAEKSSAIMSVHSSSFFLFWKEKLKTRTVKISSQLEKKGEKKKTQAHASEVLAHYKFQRQTEKKKKRNRRRDAPCRCESPRLRVKAIHTSKHHLITTMKSREK